MLLITARISQEKRIHLIAESLQYLPGKYKLVVAGTAQPWCSDYQHEILRLAGDRVKTLPAVSHPGDLLRACDAVISASEYEGYGLSMAEGILAARPVIATQRGLLENYPHLAAIVPGDADAKQWAEAIASDFALPEIQWKRVLDAKDELARDHSIQAFVGSWRSLIDTALHGRQGTKAP